MCKLGLACILATFFAVSASARAAVTTDAVLFALNGIDKGIQGPWRAVPILCYEARTGRTRSGDSCVRLVPAAAQAKLRSGGLVTLQVGGYSDPPRGPSLRSFSVRAVGEVDNTDQTLQDVVYAVWPPEAAARVHFYKAREWQVPPAAQAELYRAARKYYHPQDAAARAEAKKQVDSARSLSADFDGDGVIDRVSVLQSFDHSGWDLFLRPADQGPFGHRHHEPLTDYYNVELLGAADLDGDGRAALVVAATYEADDWWLAALLPTAKGWQKLRLATPAFVGPAVW